MKGWHPDYIDFLRGLQGKKLADFTIKCEPVFGANYYRAYLGNDIICGMPTIKKVEDYIKMSLDRATKIS